MTRAFLGRATRTALILALSALAGGACKKSSSSSGSSQQQEDMATAQQFYIQNVHPALQNCIGCHSPGGAGPAFMASNAQASYSAIEGTVGLIAAPKNSPLVQYVHKDPTIIVSPEQRSVLTTWLSLEATARNLAGAVAKPKSITDAYAQFAACMDFDVWEYYRVGDLAFSETDSSGPCLGCHSVGQGSAWMSADSELTFNKVQTFPFIQKFVVGQLDSTGGFESLVASNRFVLKSTEQCPVGSLTCHPSFGLPPNVQTGIEGFVETTLENLASGDCSNGIVVPQPDGAPPTGDGG